MTTLGLAGGEGEEEGMARGGAREVSGVALILHAREDALSTREERGPGSGAARTSGARQRAAREQ
jgi:hypothetical protein